jgi:hypothetical protein
MKKQRPAADAQAMVVDQLRTALKNLDYGTVLVEVHDGKVVHVKAADNKRFMLVEKFDAGAGI